MKHYALILFLALSVNCSAQFAWDVGINVGAANYLGEFGGAEQARQNGLMDINMAQTSYAYGGFIRKRFGYNFAVMFEIIQLELHGADSLSANAPRAGRNLSFRNKITEFSLKPEFNFLTEHDIGHGRRQIDFKAYVYTGFTVFLHNPQAEYEGVMHDLRPLKLEGQTEPYGLVEAAVPLGVGFYFTFNKVHRFGWEMGWRITFTDYLDDTSDKYPHPDVFNGDPLAIALSNRNPEVEHNPDLPGGNNYGYNFAIEEGNKRGDPSHDDHYLVTGFNYSYVIRSRRSSFRDRYRYVYGGNKRRKKTKIKL